MRVALLLVLTVLVAGCAAPVPPAERGVSPPPGPSETNTVQVGTLTASGEASYAFHVGQPVMLLAPAFFSLDPQARTVEALNPAYPPGPALLKLEGFGDAGWASLPSGGASLLFARGGQNATFELTLTEHWFVFEQRPGEGARCGGAVRYASGHNATLSEDGSLNRAPPGERVTLDLAGPGPCAGMRVEFGHLGAFTRGPGP